MKKNKKKLILIIGIPVLVLAVAAALLFTIGPLGAGTVNVYPVAEMANSNMYMDATEAYGSVRAEGFQNIMLSDTQNVTKIHVKEGQKVKKGDALLSYDTTLSDIELERASLEVNRCTLELENAKKELYEITQMMPASERLVKPDNSWLRYDPVKTPYKMSGKGTKKDPMYLIIDAEDQFNADYFSGLLPKNSKTLYAVFMIREHNAVNGKILSSFSLAVTCDGSDFSFQPFTAEIPDSLKKYDKPKEPYYEHEGSDYSAAELVTMKKEKEKEIRQAELDLKSAELEYRQMNAEANDNVVRAKKKGIVQTVRDPQQAYEESLPVLEISSGGGYYLDAAISEMDLEVRKIGDTVTIEAYSSEVTCDGTIQKIGTAPVENADAYSGGNKNISYYPCTIFVEGKEHLTPGEYASVRFPSANVEDASFYLENMFIRRDKQGPYVLAEGANGRLEKRRITTGRIFYGSTTQIKDGLTEEDFIAFPYGKKTKAGAKAVQATMDQLYSY